MVKLAVKPLEEVNGVKFGMKRSMVRKVLGEAKEFKKAKFSKTTADDFGYCHVFYNLADECEAVEIFQEAEVLVNGEVLFPSTIEKAKELVGEFVEEDGSYINVSKSIGIYAPNGKMESILFGAEGYYE